jgi:Polymerase beta, Nucleotidyltransferase
VRRRSSVAPAATQIVAVSAELSDLASVFDEWVAPAPGVPAVYLFGSRVRGDHRADSDVDVRLFLSEWSGDDATNRWWGEQNRSDFAALKARLPGRLEIHRDDPDDADPAIRSGARSPVYVRGRVVCVWTPPLLRGAAPEPARANRQRSRSLG